MPALSRDNPPGPRAERRRLLVNSANGFVLSMNCDNCDDEKNSLIEAVRGRMLVKF